MKTEWRCLVAAPFFGPKSFNHMAISTKAKWRIPGPGILNPPSHSEKLQQLMLHIPELCRDLPIVRFENGFDAKCRIPANSHLCLLRVPDRYRSSHVPMRKFSIPHKDISALPCSSRDNERFRPHPYWPSPLHGANVLTNRCAKPQMTLAEFCRTATPKLSRH